MLARPFNLKVVLVRSLYDSNIGASSRAMANMGVEDLILIAPQCELTYAAQQAAATGQSALQNRRVYSSWDDFFEKERDGLRIALTARDGKGRLVEDLGELLRDLPERDSRWKKSDASSIPVYLIFGPEDWGLSGDDLQLVHHSCSIPTFGDNSSLNLAQAVLLALFIVRTTWGGKKFEISVRSEESRNQGRDSLFPEESLKDFLEAMGFSLANPKINVFTVFRRMLLRAFPTEKERRILEIIFRQGARKMRGKN